MKFSFSRRFGKQFNKPGRNQAGDAMISYSVAAILVAIASIAVFMALKENSRKDEANQSVSIVATTAGNLQAQLGAYNKYSDVTTEVAVRMGLIPAVQRDLGTVAATNIYGGAVTVTPKTLTGTNDAAALSWKNVPVNQCSDIVSGTQNRARQITVGTTVVKNLDATVATAALSTACDAAAPVEVIWDIGRSGA